MVSQLYETLGVSRDASNEEIRKAYKKRALQTHPDRLPPGASAGDKTNAEEQFRKVNNAYEVLMDEQKRKDYDRFGVWPPPESGPSTPFSGDQYGAGRHRSSREQRSPFDDPFFHEPMFSPSGFFDSPFSRPRQRRPDFMFTDPFALFEALLGEHRRAFHEPFMDDMLSSSPFLFDPLSHRSLLGPSLFDRTSTFPGFNSLEGPSSWNDDHHRSQSANYRSLSYGGFGRGANGGNNWVSESRTTRTVNGVTETIWKRRDIDGNEHVTHFSPDGRERYYINGVDQSSHGATNRSIPPPPASAERGIPPPVPPVDRSIPPPPYPGDTIRQHSPTRKRERSSTRQYNENYAHQGNPVNGDAHSRKRWWRGQW